MPISAPPSLIDETYFTGLYGPNFSAAQLELIVPAVSAEVKRFTSRDFYTATYTDYFDGSMAWGQKFILSQFPVTAMTSIHSDPARGFGVLTLVPSTSYWSDLRRGIIQMNPNVRLEQWTKSVKVVYTAGYGATMADIPDDIKMATAMWCAISLKTWQNDQIGLTSARQGDVSVVFDRGKPPKGVRETLVRIKDRAYLAA